ncbi:MAG: anaerobic ribonucleoside-triphosphate reductase [Bacteroidales bacterium]|nr:anaerobic ribonucleoside-triphosphate reductase [Bacteroidales bacterium]
MNIIKRNGEEVPFDRSKIVDAISKANAEVDAADRLTEARIERIASQIEKRAEGCDHALGVEDVQDMVETKIVEAGCGELAKKYIKYRFEREQARNEKALKEKLTASNVQNQNANVDENSFGGRMGEMASYVTKKYALEHLVSKKAARNHLNNEIYIHDLDSYALGSHNCLSIPFDKLLANGFTTRQCDIRPAGSINTAFQLLAVIFQLQSLQQFGGVSATHLDWTMVPYVRKSFRKHFLIGYKYITGSECIVAPGFEVAENMSIDSAAYKAAHEDAYVYAMDMTTKELEQAVEGMYHNLNTLQSRSGNQLPFTSINYGTCTLPEGRMVVKTLLEGSIKGVGKFGKTPIFPCGIFQCMKGVNRNPGDPNYDLFQLALMSTSMRLYPNYANVDWSGNEGYDPENPCTYFSTMGCRTANGWDVNADDPKLVQLKDGRGNICPVTIILPTLAMKAKKKIARKRKAEEKETKLQWCEQFFEDSVVEEFMKILDKKINEAKDMLIERFEWICSQPAKSARFMYENGTMYGYKPEEGIRSALKHGTLAIGKLGLAETLQILVGCDHTEENGMSLAKRVEQMYKDKCAEFKQRYKLNFGNYNTPSENLCYTAMKKFKEKYGEIPNVSDRLYFTNSIHCPVWKKLTPFEKIDIESQLTGYSSAGCITYIEMDSSTKNNVEALETVVNYAMDKDIPYFAINIPNDSCEDCGYTDDLPDTCPKCGSKNIKRLRRVTGYLTGSFTEAFNLGKQSETLDRVKHVGVEI